MQTQSENTRGGKRYASGFSERIECAEQSMPARVVTMVPRDVQRRVATCIYTLGLTIRRTTSRAQVNEDVLVRALCQHRQVELQQARREGYRAGLAARAMPPSAERMAA